MIKPDSDTSVMKVRYLIADDHAPFRGMIVSCLPPEDSEIVECVNGQEAIESFESFQPDWVLMDIEMPILDGLSATREISKRHPEAKIVVITQNDSPEMKKAALAAGAGAFLSKDHLVDLSDLLATA